MESYQYIQAMEAGSYCDAAKLNPEFLKKLLSEDAKAKVVCQVSKTFSLDYVSLQTSTMGEVFSQFPEVLLVIRCHDDDQRALYTFLADGPRVGGSYEMTRMVHVAVPVDETPKGLARMYHIMKEMNPYWTSIQVFLVAPSFTEVNAIHEAFPSADVVLAASHVYTYIKQRIRDLCLPEKVENIIFNALKNTMCSATDRNLKGMYKILQQFVDPSMFTKIKGDWLLTDRIWALHRWRSWNDCLQYIEMVESLSHGLNVVFNISPCLKSTMSSFVSFCGQAAGKSKPDARDCSPEELAMLLKCKSEICEGPFEEPRMEAEAAASMSESLGVICNPAAFRLCANELDVTQTSVELVGAGEDQVCVQILEKPNEICGDKYKTCTCSFHQCTKLPCRHILAALNASKKTLQSDMLHTAWRKQTDGPTSSLPVTPETLEIMEAQGRHVSENHLLADTLTSQISVILAECSEEVFQHRYNTLRELADTWIGPYEEVKL